MSISIMYNPEKQGSLLSGIKKTGLSGYLPRQS